VTQRPAEPSAPDPAWPRYTRAPLPPYRFVPGRSPHPRRDPRGHAFGRPEIRPEPLDPAAWAGSSLYRRGIDLYNFAYWWESHEVFEALWQGAGKRGELAGFAQGMVQIAAAHLKQFMGSPEAAAKLLERGLLRLREAPSPYLGVSVRQFEREVAAYFQGASARPALIRLELPRGTPETI
jgi:predicted metal-dependent hydrolase